MVLKATVQKQSFKQSLPKVSSKAFFKIDSLKNLNTVKNRKTSVLESLSNKIADLKAQNLLKKRLRHRCFPVYVAKVLRAALF